jgi:hypothetical protein
MGISRSTYYDASGGTAIIEAIAAICDEFEHYGWRPVQAALGQQGMIVNHKKIKRLMRKRDLQPRTRRRWAPGWSCSFKSARLLGASSFRVHIGGHLRLQRFQPFPSLLDTSRCSQVI